jgi:hyperosmotically inducible protein
MNAFSKLAVISAFALTLGAASAVHAESTGQYLDDATVTTKVKAALVGDEQLKATKINVTTDKGTVKLSGKVDSKNQAAEAVRVAAEITGVTSVKDMMHVAGN